MLDDLSAITPDSLLNLTDDEAEQLLEALETKHRDKCRVEMAEYARYIEVPGTPSPASQDTLAALLEQKERQRYSNNPDQMWEDPENVPWEADVEESEYYPQQLMPAAVHDLIMNSIQALIEEEIVTGPLANGHEGIIADGVMLFMPPGTAKSSYGSVVAPSWVMGRWPGIDVINLSYASELAKRFGRRTRAIARSERYGQVFRWKDQPVSVVSDNSAVDQWSLNNGSTFRAVGILGGVTGNRADIVFLDDPIAGREEAESEIVRTKTNSAIRDDVFTRLKPRGKVVIIQTRWHEDDPSGNLLGEDWEGQSGLWKGTDGRWWLVLCCPLLCDRLDDPLGRQLGERLWPEWFTEKYVELAKLAGERAWASLYQQKPAASEGVIMLKRYWRCWPHGKAEETEEQTEEPELTEPPLNWTQCVLSYDTAIEDGQDNDYSAMSAWAAFGRKPSNKQLAHSQEEQLNLILLGGWRAKVQAVDLMKYVSQHVDFFKPDWILVEKKASGHQLLQELKRSRPRYTDLGQVHYVGVADWTPPFPPNAKGKTPRAHSAAISLEAGTVWYMPGKTSQSIIKECAAVPNGRYDDWADTVTQLLIWSRSINLLEVPADAMTEDEEKQQEREEAEFQESERSLYGNSGGTRQPSQAARTLYGNVGSIRRPSE